MVQNYRKKPVVIQALQFNGENYDEVLEFTGWKAHASATPKSNRVRLLIPTLEGTMEASKGDYIVKGVDGEFYPCKPNIFNQTYESA